MSVTEVKMSEEMDFQTTKASSDAPGYDSGGYTSSVRSSKGGRSSSRLKCLSPFGT